MLRVSEQVEAFGRPIHCRRCRARRGGSAQTPARCAARAHQARAHSAAHARPHVAKAPPRLAVGGYRQRRCHPHRAGGDFHAAFDLLHPAAAGSDCQRAVQVGDRYRREARRGCRTHHTCPANQHTRTADRDFDGDFRTTDRNFHLHSDGDADHCADDRANRDRPGRAWPFYLEIVRRGEDSLFVKNISAEALPLNPLRLGDGDAAILGDEWIIPQLEVLACVAAWKEGGNPKAPEGVDCTPVDPVGARVTREGKVRFWKDAFKVYYNNQEVGECTWDSPGSCVVSFSIRKRVPHFEKPRSPVGEDFCSMNMSQRARQMSKQWFIFFGLLIVLHLLLFLGWIILEPFAMRAPVLVVPLIAVYLILFAAIMLIFYRRLGRAAWPPEYREAQERGLPATAKVLEIERTHWRVRPNWSFRLQRRPGKREYQMRLRVTRPGEPDYEALMAEFLTGDQIRKRGCHPDQSSPAAPGGHRHGP
jgi:hypothetical protein